MKTLCFICTNFSTNTLHTWPTYRFFLYNCSSPKSIEKLIWLGSRTICINVDSHSLCRFSILYGGGAPCIRYLLWPWCLWRRHRSQLTLTIRQWTSRSSSLVEFTVAAAPGTTSNLSCLRKVLLSIIYQTWSCRLTHMILYTFFI